MNYSITQTTDMCLIKQIMCNNTLFKASMPDEDITLLELNLWEPPRDCTYLVYTKGSKAIGIVRLYHLTNITVDLHMHLLPKYWGRGESERFTVHINQWLRDHTQYCKIMIQTPQCCEHVLKAASREGYQLEGVLSGAICWRGNIENLVLMSKFIDRN